MTLDSFVKICGGTGCFYLGAYANLVRTATNGINSVVFAPSDACWQELLEAVSTPTGNGYPPVSESAKVFWYLHSTSFYSLSILVDLNASPFAPYICYFKSPESGLYFQRQFLPLVYWIRWNFRQFDKEKHRLNHQMEGCTHVSVNRNLVVNFVTYISSRLHCLQL